MNVTIKLDDNLCRAARHRAVDLETSLSGWISTLVMKELASVRPPVEQTLAEQLADHSPYAHLPIPVPERKCDPEPEIDFS